MKRIHWGFLVMAVAALLGCERSDGQTSGEGGQAEQSRPAPTPASLGTFAKNGVTVTLRDRYVRWQPEARKLEVVLTPSALTEDERARLEDGDPEFFVLSDKPSPDESKWQWYPHVVVELRFDAAEVSRDSLSGIYVKAWGIEENNHTDSINATPGGEHTFQALSLRDGELTLDYAGESSIMDDEMAWRIRI